MERQQSESRPLFQLTQASRVASERFRDKMVPGELRGSSHTWAEVPQEPAGDNIMTSFVFRVRNIPAALYKAMGGFATNGVNMVKLESYMIDGSFTATQFYADIEGHPDDPAVQRAFDELDYFTSYMRVLGAYPASDFRKGIA